MPSTSVGEPVMRFCQTSCVCGSTVSGLPAERDRVARSAGNTPAERIDVAAVEHQCSVVDYVVGDAAGRAPLPSWSVPAVIVVVPV